MSISSTRWAAVVSSVLLACGGQASRNTQETQAAGATGAGGGASSIGGMMARAGAMSGGSDAGGVVDVPSTVTLISPAGDGEGLATPSMLGPCFRGFNAVVNDMRIELEAFVQAPGDYQGDPLHILYVAVTRADGRTFSASTNSQPFGEIALHVTAVTPRFVGGVKATLYDGKDPNAPPLTLSLAFDVDAGESCSL